MHVKNRLLICFAVCFFSLVLFVLFRTVPMSRLWSGCQILYVSSEELSTRDIIALLDKYGLHDVVYSENQRIPVFSDISPVQAQDSLSYIFARNAFFSDETGQFSVFYIPGDDISSLQKAVAELASFSRTRAGTDSSRTFPWAAPVICLVSALICIFISRENRKMLAAACAFPLLLAFTKPMFTLACCVCLCIAGFTLLAGIYRRRGFVSFSLKSVYICALVFLPAVLLFITSAVNAFFYLLAVSSSVCLVYCVQYISSLLLSRKTSFDFVYIRSAKMIPLIGRKGINVFAAAAVSVILILLTSLAGSALSAAADTSDRPALPSPVSSAEVLPDFEAFNQWAWNTLTFPYRKLDEKRTPVSDGTTVSITEYTEKNGTISAEKKDVFVYNSNFRKTVENMIEDLDYPALEKLMLRQGKNTKYGYTRETGSAYEKYGSFIVILLALIPVSLAAYYILGRRRYGLGI